VCTSSVDSQVYISASLHMVMHEEWQFYYMSGIGNSTMQEIFLYYNELSWISRSIWAFNVLSLWPIQNMYELHSLSSISRTEDVIIGPFYNRMIFVALFKHKLNTIHGSYSIKTWRKLYSRRISNVVIKPHISAVRTRP
jgi:hypothetical protein